MPYLLKFGDNPNNQKYAGPAALAVVTTWGDAKRFDSDDDAMRWRSTMVSDHLVRHCNVVELLDEEWDAYCRIEGEGSSASERERNRQQAAIEQGWADFQAKKKQAASG